MYKTPAFLLLFVSLGAAEQPLFRVVDINIGQTERIQLPGSKPAAVKLLALGRLAFSHLIPASGV